MNEYGLKKVVDFAKICISVVNVLILIFLSVIALIGLLKFAGIPYSIEIGILVVLVVIIFSVHVVRKKQPQNKKGRKK